jgi:integrase
VSIERICDRAGVLVVGAARGLAAALIGEPLQSNNIGERGFLSLIKKAGVRVISFHGMRHTTATLLLMAGEPIHVVAQRLGHSDVSITWNTYSHVLPNQQKQAAARLAGLLHG